MKRLTFGFFILGLLVTILFSCSSQDIVETRELQISHVDIDSAQDGKYTGDYSYGGYTYEVEVEIKDRRIAKILIVSNRDTKHAKIAEEVIPVIVRKQQNNVDAMSGATTTSKALLKAIEKALLKSID